MSDYSIKRGPYGKPWITRDGLPLQYADGEDKPFNGHLYDRPSTISGNLDTKENLSPYEQAQVVFGLLREDPPSLIWQFRALASEHRDPWNGAKAEVKSLLKLAKSLGGENAKSGIGSALHRYSVLRDKGEREEFDVRQLTPWLDCYQEAMEPFEVLDWERFVVVDDLENEDSLTDLRVAGNFDKLLRHKETGEVMIGDLKSGKSDNEFAMKPTMQVAMYSRGMLFDQETGTRVPIHPDLSLTTGVMIHLPYHGGGPPQCTTYRLDLTEGWRLAQMSMDATKSRKMRAYVKNAFTRVKWKEAA